MHRTWVTLSALALAAFAAAPPSAEASGGSIDTCVFGNGGVCVIASNGCVGVGFGLQGVGACSRDRCATIFVGFNQIGTCGGTVVLP